MKHEQGLNRIQSIISRLLGPGGCPWDQEQSPHSLCDYLIEEAFELVSAIRSNDAHEIREEMGDVFFLLLFIAHLYEQDFTLEDVWQENAAKMIARHPHVFENEKFHTRDDLLRNWEKVKKEQKKSKNKSPFFSIPRNLPPLIMAYRISSKAARAGFTWDRDEEVEGKLSEEWQEFIEARQDGDQDRMEQEFGDYLFTLVEYGRRNKIKASTALSRTNISFLSRIEKMEELALEKGLDISELNMRHLDALWDEAKALK